MSETLTKEEFIRRLHRDVDDFDTYISELNKEMIENETPDAICDNLKPVDWFEQFLVHVGG